jgi:peptidoglycan/xylan/chitin deacetylase (PgdA/CDA1 family)
MTPRSSAATTGVPLPKALVDLDVARLPTNARVIALTFDAGANADGVPKILDTLRAENVVATFFLTGTWAELFPAQARLIASEHAIGNHSMTHPHFNQLSDAAVTAEVNDTRVIIKRTTGIDPQPIFRFPFGEHNAHNRELVNHLGYVSVAWTVDTLGWQGTSAGRTTGTVVQRVLADMQPGEIVLMHVGSNPTDRSTLDADALRTVIDSARQAGYSFVTVPQGLNLR